MATGSMFAPRPPNTNPYQQQPAMGSGLSTTPLSGTLAPGAGQLTPHPPTGSGGFGQTPYNPSTGYGVNAGQTGTDPRGMTQGQIGYQQNRFENQQGPIAGQAAYNYGKASDTGFNDYNTGMNMWSGMARQYGVPTGGPSGGGGGGAPNGTSREATRAGIVAAMQQNGITPGDRGSGAGDVEYYTDQAMSTGGWTPDNAGYWTSRLGSDAHGGGGGGGFGGGGAAFPGFSSPAYGYFQNFAGGGGDVGLDPEAAGAISASLGGYGDFASTGGLSAQDMASLRARAISPIRSAYSSAERGVQQQRSLQGGYSPNAIAARVKMAREQGQSAADATTNAEAAIAQMKQQGREFGIAGQGSVGMGKGNLMASIDAANKERQMAGAQGMAGLDQFGANLGLGYAGLGYQYADLNQRGQLGAMQGFNNLYSSAPGMASKFGDQALSAVQTGGQFGSNMVNGQVQAGNQTGAFDQSMNRVNQVGGLVNAGANAIRPFLPNGQPNPRYNPNAYPGGPPDSYPYQGPQNQAPYGPDDYPWYGPNVPQPMPYNGASLPGYNPVYQHDPMDQNAWE